MKLVKFSPLCQRTEFQYYNNVGVTSHIIHTWVNGSLLLLLLLAAYSNFFHKSGKTEIFESLPSALFLTRSWSDIQSIALCCILSNAEFPRNWKFRAVVIVGEFCSKSLHHLLFSSVLRTFHTFLLLQIAIRVILTRIQYGPHPTVKKLSKQNFRRVLFSFFNIFRLATQKNVYKFKKIFE